MSRIRCALVTAAAALVLLPAAAVATAHGGHRKAGGNARQLQRPSQIERKRIQALVDGDVAVAGRLIASDFELINPLGEIADQPARRDPDPRGHPRRRGLGRHRLPL
jgi:hypothetical protein